MAVAAATAMPAMLQAGVPTVSQGGGDSRCPSRRYRKYELIGQGAQKKVYRAFDEERGIEVAWNEVAVAELARFREKDQQRVFAEIRVLKQLKHKNIMTLFDYWFDQRRLMLVFITEIFPDGTLRQYRRRHKHADVPAIKHWAWQVLQGLVYLHGHNPPIIHRDLKCDNIFVCGSSGAIKIGDLGLVTLCKDLTAPQSVLGTPEFMAPELYEEKYDEKVDVYAFGMCLLELATMEYPYCECKNAAQIYKKVTQGIPPASVEKLASAELRDFVMLCLCHDPKRRPEARQLLKHSFFEAIRSSPSHIGSYGTPPKLTVVSSMSVSPTVSTLRPVTLTSVASATAAALVAAAMDAQIESPTELSRAGSGSPTRETSHGGSSSGAVEVGGIAAAAGLATGAQTGMWSIAAAAGASMQGSSSTLSVRSTSVELPGVQPVMGAIAASVSPQPTSPIAADASGMQPPWCGDRSSVGGATAGFPLVQAATIAAPTPAMKGDVAGSAVAGPAAGVGMSPLSVCGLGSIASSLSPTAPSGGLSSSLAYGGSASSSPGMPLLNSAAAAGGVAGSSPGPAQGGGGGMANASGPSSPASALTAALHLSPQQASGIAAAGAGIVLPGVLPSDVGGFVAPGNEAEGLGRRCSAASSNGGYAVHGSESRSQQPGGPCGVISASAAAIATAAVNAAAAAVGASSGPSLTSPLGLPSIHEDHELNEDMLFDQDDSVRRGSVYRGGSTCDDESQDEEDMGEEEDCGSGAESPGGAAGPAVMGGGRSQPVNLKVRSSSQAAVTNMALSFAMSFTSQRGVRKKVGFQYDLLHDTASAIAVEMVENLSLNTAEAEAIAAMIQHEVSRFHVKQQEQDQQTPQQDQQTPQQDQPPH